MISLKCERIVQIKLKSTKAKFWENIKSGDKLIFTYFLTGSYGSTAHIQIEDKSTGERIENSALNLKSNMSKFVFDGPIILETSVLIEGFKKKTKAKFWGLTEIGDIISFKYFLSGGYGSTPSVSISSEKGSRDENPLSLKDNLSKFDYKELTE